MAQIHWQAGFMPPTFLLCPVTGSAGPLIEPRDPTFGSATYHQVTGREFLEASVLRIHLLVGPTFWGRSKVLTPRPRNSGVSRLEMCYRTWNKTEGYRFTGDAIYHLGWGQLAWEDLHLGNSTSLAQKFPSFGVIMLWVVQLLTICNLGCLKSQ